MSAAELVRKATGSWERLVEIQEIQMESINET
jgi:hypothetical protein